MQYKTFAEKEADNGEKNLIMIFAQCKMSMAT